jgi:hypothetical protein
MFNKSIIIQYLTFGFHKMLGNSWVLMNEPDPWSLLVFLSCWFISYSIISPNIRLLLLLKQKLGSSESRKLNLWLVCSQCVCLHLVEKRIILSLSGIKYWPFSPYPVTPLSYPIPQMSSVWRGFYARYDHVTGGIGEATNRLPRGNMTGNLIQRPWKQYETDDMS